jgi:hypothetical protein
MGPIGVKAHLAPFMPSHPVIPTGAAPSCWNSQQIFITTMSWMYTGGAERSRPQGLLLTGNGCRPELLLSRTWIQLKNSRFWHL